MTQVDTKDPKAKKLSETALAALLGIGRKTLFRYRREAGWPGGDDLGALRTWIEANKGKHRKAAAASKPPPEQVIELPEAADDAFQLTVIQLAKLAGVTAPTIANWTARGLPRLPGAGQRGKPSFDLRQALPWVVLYYQGRVKEAGESRHADIDAAELRRKRADADLKEMDLAKERDAFLPRAEVRDMLFRVMAIFRDRILGLGHNLAALVAAETSEARTAAIIDSEARAALEDMSEMLGTIGNDENEKEGKEA